MHDGRRRSATFLPEVAAEQGWTQAQTIEALLRKGGVAGPPSPAVWASITAERYQSQKTALTHAEWLAVGSAGMGEPAVHPATAPRPRPH